MWRCDVTKNPVGTDTRMIGAPPCKCQGCRASAIIEAQEDALEARDKTIAELVEKNKGLQDVLEEKRETINSLRALISQDIRNGGK